MSDAGEDVHAGVPPGLPPRGRPGNPGLFPCGRMRPARQEALAGQQYVAIAAALAAHRGCIAAAAKALHITEHTLARKMAAFGFPRPGKGNHTRGDARRRGM